MVPDLETLVRLFYRAPEALGDFEEVEPRDMPPVFRKLLVHEHHMTVTVEKHHGCPVDVRVLQKRITPTHYAREILLARQSDGQVVQYGIMRVNFGYLDAAVRAEIESEATPLGRILVAHNVLRRINLFSQWRIAPTARLCELLEIEDSTETEEDNALYDNAAYGRTALIYCNEEPAIELLEIVPG